MLKQFFKEKRVNLNVKINREEYEAIKANANAFTGGNVSAWIKWSATNCKPLKSQLKE